MTGAQFEDLAHWLCCNDGGAWDAKYHKRKLWRIKARAFLAELPDRYVPVSPFERLWLALSMWRRA